jgi:hypothetical protein
LTLQAMVLLMAPLLSVLEVEYFDRLTFLEKMLQLLREVFFRKCKSIDERIKGHDYALNKLTKDEEMKAKIAIEGNVCLLDKYKRDAAYNKLPWLRKLIHLGDYDPFDGNKPNKNCD